MVNGVAALAVLSLKAIPTLSVFAGADEAGWQLSDLAAHSDSGGLGPADILLRAGLKEDRLVDLWGCQQPNHIGSPDTV